MMRQQQELIRAIGERLGVNTLLREGGAGVLADELGPGDIEISSPPGSPRYDNAFRSPAQVGVGSGYLLGGARYGSGGFGDEGVEEDRGRRGGRRSRQQWFFDRRRRKRRKRRKRRAILR